MTEADISLLSYFAFFLAGTGLIAWWASTLDRPEKPRHPAAGE